MSEPITEDDSGGGKKDKSADKGKDEKKGKDKDEKKEGADKGADKGSSGENKSGCPPGKTCVVRDLAKNINSFGDAAGAVGDKINKTIESKAANAASSVKTLFNPAKCAANAAIAVPKMAGDIASAVGNGLAMSFDRAAASLQKLTNEAAKLVDGDDGLPDIFAPFKIVVLSSMKRIQGMFGNMVFGAEKWAKIQADPNMKSDKIVDDMSKASEAFNRIVDSPAFQRIFNKWLMGYAEAMDKVIQMGKPKIDGVTNKLTGIVDDTSAKIGKAFTNSLTTIIGAALKSIPFVGVVFNVADVAHKMAAKIVSVCEPAVSKGGVSLVTIANAGLDQVKNAKCRVEDLTNKLSAIMPSSSSKQSGGSTYKNRFVANKKKIMRATKRLLYMLKNKTKKHPIKINYAAKLKTRRFR